MPKFVLQNGWSPLEASSFNGHLNVVKALIKDGSNIYQADKDSTHICSVIVIHSHKIYMCALSNEYSPLFVYM